MIEAGKRQLRAWLAAAERVLCITGAGISAESGLPTYRGTGGLYEDADTEDGVSIEEALSGPYFRRHPDRCWAHLARIERACRGALPNAAHLAIAAWEADREVVVLTQNVDGLHHLAGSTRIIDIHGDVHRLRCPACGWGTRVDDYAGLSMPPPCPDCGAVIRPDVVLFGELLPPDAVRRLMTELERGFDLVLSIGTTSVFPYIAEPVWQARRSGVPTVEINPGDTEVSEVVDLRLRCGAVEALVGE